MPADSPRHIAVIMDGNRRWAKARGKSEREGWREGEERIYEVAEKCRDLGVTALTLFAFSTENWSRPAAQVEGVMDLLGSALQRRVPELIADGIRLHFVGRRDRLAERTQKRMAQAEQQTAEAAQGAEREHHLTVALDFSGRWDLVRAARELAVRVAAGELDPQRLDEAALDEGVSLRQTGLPPVDLLIRTGDEHRISNFLLWDIAYAELYFSPLMWPDFGADALREAVADFQGRQRRFGGG